MVNNLRAAVGEHFVSLFIMMAFFGDGFVESFNVSFCVDLAFLYSNIPLHPPS